MMKKSVIVLFLVMALILVSVACGGGRVDSVSETGSGSNNDSGVSENGEPGAEKNLITIRGVRSVTGPDAVYEQSVFDPLYSMWAGKINEEGGLFVKALERKLPIEIEIYDDKSDAEKTVQLFERVVADEKPDLIFAPGSTAAILNCAPLAQKYDYLLLTAEGSAKELENYLPPYGEYANTYSLLNHSETQALALAKILGELEVESIYCVYADDMYGIEYWKATRTALDAIGIRYTDGGSVPPGRDIDADGIVFSAELSGADVFLCFTYPDESVAITKSAVKLEYNPDIYLVGSGGSCDYFVLSVFGDPDNRPLEGMMALGAWSENSNPFGDERAKEYSRDFRNYWIDQGLFWKNPDGSLNTAVAENQIVYQDWWSHICGYSALQVLQQAVENAGSLNEYGNIDNLALAGYIRDNSFNTVLHPELRFTDNILSADMYYGNIGQWQNGVFEVIDADGRGTAEPVYPKPAWLQRE